jgi:hypothetical protein
MQKKNGVITKLKKGFEHNTKPKKGF